MIKPPNPKALFSYVNFGRMGEIISQEDCFNLFFDRDFWVSTVTSEKNVRCNCGLRISCFAGELQRYHSTFDCGGFCCAELSKQGLVGSKV